MQVEGIVKVIYDTHQVSEKFKKRDFVLTIDAESNYPQHVLFQTNQAKVDLLDTVRPGTKVKVHGNLKGREWTNKEGEVKYFNTLECWKLEILAMPGASQENTAPPVFTSNSADDDLPF